MDLPEITAGDPFAEVESVDRIREPETLDLRELIGQEARLAEAGVTCARKDEAWTRPSCSTCPLTRTPALVPLCKIGLAQERLVAGDVLAAA